MSNATSMIAVGLSLGLLAGCADDAAGTAAPEAECGPVEEQRDEGHQHLVGDAEPPVDYGTVPPTSGWHMREPDRVRAAIGVRGPDEPLSELEQASVLAVDAVVVTYNDLPDEELRALVELVEADYDGRVAVTPYDRLEPGQVALTAWRRLQRCDGVDTEAVAAFIDEYAAAEPDFTMSGEHDDH